MNGLSPKHDAHAAVVTAQRSYAERQAAERKATGIGYDPACRLARWIPETHICVRNTGEQVRPGESCHVEARLQLRDQYDVASDGALIDAMRGELGGDAILTDDERDAFAESAPRGPVYRYVDCDEAAS